jgi:hypothetical protein
LPKDLRFGIKLYPGSTQNGPGKHLDNVIKKLIYLDWHLNIISAIILVERLVSN